MKSSLSPHPVHDPKADSLMLGAAPWAALLLLAGLAVHAGAGPDPTPLPGCADVYRNLPPVERHVARDSVQARASSLVSTAHTLSSVCTAVGRSATAGLLPTPPAAALGGRLCRRCST
jgi:hypothetical protein